MKRRSFLLGMLAAPVAPFLSKVSVPAPFADVGRRAIDKMMAVMTAAAERAANPPIVVSESGAILPLGLGPDWLEIYQAEARRVLVERIDHDILREINRGERA